MNNLTFLKYVFHFGMLFFASQVSAQQKLVLNGAMINIANGATLVVSNPDTNAIIRNNGHIITEGENNKIKWNIGTTTGNYVVPSGYVSNYIPLTFTKTAGSGNGYFIFSTYHTGWNNAANLPAGVSNVNYNGIDNSSYTIDRFWQMDAAGYTAKPDLVNLTFTYIDAEYLASGNSITENQLGIQRWNSTVNDWGDFIPGVTVNTINNKVSLATVSSANLYKWWTLPSLNSNHMLPVELIKFNGICDNGLVNLSWSTASELDNDHFTVERSDEGIDWSIVKLIKESGNNNKLMSYSTTDEPAKAQTYYRLVQTDINGNSENSSMIEVNCSAIKKMIAMQVFPNPSTGFFTVHDVQDAIVEIINPLGEIVYSEKCTANEFNINLHDMSNGIYTVVAHHTELIQTLKLLIQH